MAHFVCDVINVVSRQRRFCTLLVRDDPDLVEVQLLVPPLSSDSAWTIVERWLGAPNCWIPEATERTARILGKLINELDIRGNLVSDSQLAAARHRTRRACGLSGFGFRALRRDQLDQPSRQLINHSLP